MSLKRRLEKLQPKCSSNRDAALEKIVNENIRAANEIRKLLDPEGIGGNPNWPPVDISNWTKAHKNAAWGCIRTQAAQQQTAKALSREQEESLREFEEAFGLDKLFIR